jgi:hypothetical protein
VINVDLLRELERNRAEDLCRWFFPNGRKIGHEWMIGNTAGEPGQSLKIELEGPKAGLWLDHATGEGGDFAKLLCLKEGLTFPQAVDEIGQAFGINLHLDESGQDASTSAVVKAATPTSSGSLLVAIHDHTPRPQRPLKLEDLEECTDEDLRQIFMLRAIPVDGLRLAHERRMLFAYNHHRHGRCFIISDDARRNAISRKLDGKPFRDEDPQSGEITEKKSKCCYGSEANWPIGAAQIGDFPAIALCEGMPDFLAAFWLAYAGAVESLVAPVCMTGASCRVHEDALPLFRRKRVRIFAHADKAGQDAAYRWFEQLQTVQAKVDGFDFEGLVLRNGSPVKDLNDFILADHKRSGCRIEITTGAFDFGLEGRGKCQGQ